MSEELIVKQCAPTLAGKKTGNLFSCTHEGKDKLYSQIRNLNSRLVSKGIRIIPLEVSEKKTLIYVYRPKLLKSDLNEYEAIRLLKKYGYSVENTDLCVKELSLRLHEQENFPHEIGLFLGYPPEDVAGFISNNAKCSKCVGCWKVYGDEVEAQKRFTMFKKCTNVYYSQWRKGKSIELLTVVV